MNSLEQQLARLIEECSGYDSDVLSQLRARALEYYYGIMPSSGTGRSSIVSTDVRDNIHSILASLTTIVNSTILEFDGNENNEASDAVGSKLKEFNLQLAASMHDALLTGNGFLKAYEKTSVAEVIENYPPSLSELDLYVLSQPAQANETVSVKQTQNYTKVTRTTQSKSIQIESVAPEKLLFLNSDSIEDISFLAEIHLLTEAELVEWKLPVSQPAYTYDNQGMNARLGIFAQQQGQLEGTVEEKYLIYCCYQPHEKKKSFLNSELKLIRTEPLSSSPYIIGSAIPVPHRVQGISLFELLENTQLGKTEILRQYIDNLAVSNQSRIGAVEGQVNMADLTNGRLNGIVRIKNPAALVPLPSTDIGPSALTGLGYLDSEVTAKVGASLDFSDAQFQLAKSSTVGANITAASVEKMTGWYASNIVNTLLKPLFIRVAALMGVSASQLNVNVNMGLTSMEKAQRVQGLTTIIGMQKTILETGGKDILCSMDNVYQALTDYCRAMDLDNVAQYFTSPSSPGAQQAAQASAQKSAAAQRTAEMKDMREYEIEKAKLAESHHQSAGKLRFDYTKLDRDMDLKEAELTVEVLTNDAGANRNTPS